MLDSEIRVGQLISFEYNGGSKSQTRYLRVKEVTYGYVEGIDYSENQFKSFIRSKMVFLAKLADVNEEVYSIKDLHPRPHELTDEQLLAIFKIVHPYKKNPRISHGCEFIVHDADRPILTIFLGMSESRIVIKTSGGVLELPVGELSDEDLTRLKTFAEGVQL